MFEHNPATMKSLPCIMLFVLIAKVGDAQNPMVVDSLNEVLTQKTGGDRYLPLYELAFEYVDRDNEKALEIIEEARKAALLSGDSLWIVKSMRVKAQMLARLERLAESIACGEEARRIAVNNKYLHENARIINNLAGSYGFQLRYDKALEYFFETLELSRTLGDSSLLSTALLNVGVIHFRLENYRTSLDYFLRARKISQTINKVSYYEHTNISICYANLEDFAMAKFYLNNGFKACGALCSEADFMKIKFTEAQISYCKKDYELARRQLLENYLLAQKVKSTRFQLEIIYLLAEVYLKQNQMSKAKLLLRDGERIIVKSGGLNLEKLRILRSLSQMHLADGNYKAGAFYQDKYITLKDSLYSYGLTARLMEIESEYNEKQNVKVIAKQNEVIALKEQVIARQRQVNIITGLLVFVTFILMVFFYRNYVKKERLSIILDRMIKERTHELETSRGSLMSQLRQKDLINDWVSSRLREQVLTLKSLRSTAISDVSDAVALQYIERYTAASLRLERYLMLLNIGGVIQIEAR